MTPNKVLQVLGACLSEAGDDIDSGLLAAEYILARGIPLSEAAEPEEEADTPPNDESRPATTAVEHSDISPEEKRSAPIKKPTEKRANKKQSASKKSKNNRIVKRTRAKRKWIALATDAEGHDHRGKGKDGGQFVSKGKGGNSGTATERAGRGRATDHRRADGPGPDRSDAQEATIRHQPARIVTGREGDTRRGDPGVVPENLREHLNEHQQQAVALAVPALEDTGGFLLADGTGVGKTRTILATSQVYASRGKKVLIVSPASIIKPNWKSNEIAGSIGKDGATMGVSMQLTRGDEALSSGKIHVTTYESLAKIKDHIDDDTVVLFDEAHGLKNAESIRSKQGMEIAGKASGVLYATATPADHPLDLAYLFRTQLFGDRPFSEIKRSLNPDRSNPEEAYKATAALFDKLTDKGLMVKREISLDGVQCSFDHVDLPSDARRKLSDIAEQATSAKQRAQVLMKQRFEQERHKIPHAVKTAQQELAEGRQCILFVAGVSGTPDQPGTAGQLKNALVAAGIPENKIGQLHGGEGGGGKEEVARFQSGERKILITTAQSGGTGHNLDDTTGRAPRTQILLTAPFSAIDNAQIWGRTHRLTTKSKSRIKYLFADTDVDRWNANLIKGKVKSLGAIVGGEAARQEPNVAFGNPDQLRWIAGTPGGLGGRFAPKPPDTRTISEKASDTVKGTPAYIGRRLTRAVSREVNRGLKRIEYELTAPIRHVHRRMAEKVRQWMEPVVNLTSRFMTAIMRALGMDRDETDAEDPDYDSLLSHDDPDIILALDELGSDPDFLNLIHLLREGITLSGEGHDVSGEPRNNLGRWARMGGAIKNATSRAAGVIRRGIGAIRDRTRSLVFPHRSTGRGTAVTTSRVATAMSRQGVKPEVQAKHLEAIAHISRNMTDNAHRLFTIGTTGGLNFHSNVEDVTREADMRDGSSRLDGATRVHGFLDPLDHSLHLDGQSVRVPPSSTIKGSDVMRHVNAHEMTHAIDHGNRAKTGKRFSDDTEWHRAHEKEASRLSDYAATKRADSFAEFGRLVYGSDTPRAAIKKEFPIGYAFFRRHGLIDW